jgi:hypothetical protein
MGLRKDEIPAQWKRLHNKELNDLYSPNIFWVTLSRRMRRGHLEDPGVDGTIILK